MRALRDIKHNTGLQWQWQWHGLVWGQELWLRGHDHSPFLIGRSLFDRGPWYAPQKAEDCFATEFDRGPWYAHILPPMSLKYPQLRAIFVRNNLLPTMRFHLPAGHILESTLLSSVFREDRAVPKRHLADNQESERDEAEDGRGRGAQTKRRGRECEARETQEEIEALIGGELQKHNVISNNYDCSVWNSLLHCTSDSESTVKALLNHVRKEGVDYDNVITLPCAS